MSCGCRYGSDPMLLWLWCRSVATSPIRPIAWEPPYAMGVALEKTKRKERKEEKRKGKKKKKKEGVPAMAHWIRNPTIIRECVGSIPVLTQWVKK